MLRKRTIALSVLLLIIIVACLSIRTFAPTGASTYLPHKLEPRNNTQITKPEPVEAPNPLSEKEYSDYKVETPKDLPKEPTATGKCYVGGCSGQICSDRPDVISTCEWREAYACYQKATCERQPSGQCGFTATPELNACLSADGDTASDLPEVW